MTEGIIQEVFAPILEYFYLEQQEEVSNDYESEYAKHAVERFSKVMSLQKELIEKIRQESKRKGYGLGTIGYLEETIILKFVSKLIGDNSNV